MQSRRQIMTTALAAGAWFAVPGSLHALDHGGRLLEYEDVQASGLPDQRLSIWLPPGYDRSEKRYRVLYMHDAQNLFDPALSNFNKVWAADRAMIEHAAASGEDPWIIVGIWSPGIDRYRQYLPKPAHDAATGKLRTAMDDYAQGPVVSDHYVDWMAGTLKPWVDRQLRTRPGRADTAVIGSSMGGLISLFAFLRYPELFGRAGCVSTHWPAIAPQSVEQTDPELIAIWLDLLESELGPASGRKLWFDHGTATLDQYYAPYQQRVDQFMAEAGWSRGTEWESHQYEGAEHEENAWAARLPEIFDWLLR